MTSFGLRRLFQRKDAQAARLPVGAFELSTNGLYLPNYRSKGRLTIAAIGTGGVGIASKVIEEFAKVNCLSDIGCLIVNEFDERPRVDFEAKIARNYPDLYKRSVFNRSTMISGGLQGRSWEEVNSPQIKKNWLPQVTETLFEGAKIIRGTEQYVYSDSYIGQEGYDPAVVVLLCSPGSHSSLAIPVGQFFKKEFPLAYIYGVTFKSQDGDQRAEFPKIFIHYHKANFAKHWIVGDIPRAQQAYDYAVSHFLSAIWVAPLIASQFDLSPRVDAWNVLSKLNPLSMNGVVVPRVG